MLLTRTAVCSSSSARVCISPSWANLLAAYAPQYALALCATLSEVKIMEASSAWSNSGRQAWVMKKGALALTCMTFIQSWGS